MSMICTMMNMMISKASSSVVFLSDFLFRFSFCLDFLGEILIGVLKLSQNECEQINTSQALKSEYIYSIHNEKSITDFHVISDKSQPFASFIFFFYFTLSWLVGQSQQFYYKNRVIYVFEIVYYVICQRTYPVKMIYYFFRLL